LDHHKYEMFVGKRKYKVVFLPAQGSELQLLTGTSSRWLLTIGGNKIISFVTQIIKPI
jgi:hypothetical protein